MPSFYLKLNPKNKFMKVTLVCILFFTSLLVQAQSFFKITKLDSTKWRIEEIIPGSKGGGGTIHFSDIADSTTIVSRYISLTENKRAAVEQRLAEKEYKAFNQELKRVTGRDYEALLNEKIAAILPGAWNIGSQTDSLSVNISKTLQISGGKIRGSVEVRGVDSILVSGVYPKPIVMRILAATKLEENRPCPDPKTPCPKITMTRNE